MRVLTMGTFDLFHAGHARFLERCRELAGFIGSEGEVIVGLNTDEFAASYKRRPVVPYAGREVVLRACRHVDEVWANEQPGGTVRALVEAVRPDTIAVGMDWHPDNGRDWFAQVGLSSQWFATKGIAIVWLPYTEGVSTTALIEAMAA